MSSFIVPLANLNGSFALAAAASTSEAGAAGWEAGGGSLGIFGTPLASSLAAATVPSGGGIGLGWLRSCSPVTGAPTSGVVLAASAAAAVVAGCFLR